MSYGEERVGTREDEGVRARPVERSPGGLSAEDKQWGMFCHMSALVGLVVGGLFFVGPLVCWLMKKDTSKFVDYHGKESLNFQISIFMLTMICVVTIIGWPLIPIIGIVAVIMPIIAGIKANEGEYYEYPYILRLIK